MDLVIGMVFIGFGGHFSMSFFGAQTEPIKGEKVV